MEEIAKLNQSGLLSPEPKRYNVCLSQSERLALARSNSYDTSQEFAISELSDILGLYNFPCVDRNSSPLFRRFSLNPPERASTNPIVSDEKFIELEYCLSTNEDSGSDSDRLSVHN